MSARFSDTINLSAAPGLAPASIGYLVPLYAPPESGTWDTLISAAQANSGVPFIAIVNVSSGPGDGQGEDGGGGISTSVKNYVPKLQAAGITTIGYVATGYNLGATTLTQAEQQVTDWQNWYGVTGIFFDEMSNTPGNESFYSTLTSFCHNKGLRPVFGNPGASVPSSFIGTVDVIVAYEAPGLPSASTVHSDTVAVGGTPKQWAIIAHDVGIAPTASYINSVVPDIAWIFVTNYSSYGFLPIYQDTELANIESGSSGGSGPQQALVGFFFLMNIYPGSVWNDFITAHANFSSVPMIVVANVNSGPGPASPPDPNYQSYISQMQAVGIDVLGYVDTDYGVTGNTVSTANAETQIDIWFADYNVNGIYLDRMDNTDTSAAASYYQTLASYVHSKTGFPVVWGASGAVMPTRYLSIGMDVMLPYINSGLPSAGTVASDTTGVGGTNKNWGILVFNAPTAASIAYITSVDTNIAWLCMTDETDSAFNQEPSYLNSLLGNLAAVAGGSSTGNQSATIYVYSTVAKTGIPVLPTGWLLTIAIALSSGTGVSLSTLTITDITTHTMLYNNPSPALNMVYGIGSGTSGDPGPYTTSDISDHVIQFAFIATPNGAVKLNVATDIESP